MNSTTVLVLTDNIYLATQFRALVVSKLELAMVNFEYRCSLASESIMVPLGITPINIKQEWTSLTEYCSLIISIHCKQLFPPGLVRQVRCINVHPGLNPYNRGWFPQVFSILNKLPLGATIHEIDAELDHGPIIAQTRVPVYEYDTSLTAYERVQTAEMALLEEHIFSIIQNKYQAIPPVEEGNLNLKKDYNALCELRLTESATVGQLLDRLRALTHGQYRNAFFLDEEGRKVYVSVTLEPEKN